MKSLRGVSVVVVADEFSGRTLVNRLTRMGVLQVRRVATVIETRALYEVGDADACIVTLRNFQIEDVPATTVEEPAPSSAAILLADVVTPYVARTARRSGYVGVAALTIAPRLLYRLICGALQKSRRTRLPAQVDADRQTKRRSAKSRPFRIGYHSNWPVPVGGYGKIKLSS